MFSHYVFLVDWHSDTQKAATDTVISVSALRAFMSWISLELLSHVDAITF